MVGPGLRKLARENGMSIASGVAYGSFRGFAATFSEGAGYKRLAVTTRLHDAQTFGEFADRLHAHDLKKEFRIVDTQLMNDALVFTFTDNPGTMKCFIAFCDFLFDTLASVGADGVNVCNECGTELVGGSWKLINGVAFHLHESCTERLRNNAEAQMQARRESDTGSIGGGIAGALLGALVGAIPWAVLLYMGYLAAIAGLLIGWCSKKGYELLRGKNSSAKLPIVIICVLAAVVFGNFAVDYLNLYSLISDGVLESLGIGDIVPSLVYLLSTNDEFFAETVRNLLLGALFALLGAAGIFREIHGETRKVKIKDLR